MVQKKNKLQQKYINIHQQLIDKCRKGDRKAQFGIYKHYSGAMFNTAVRITGNPVLAEEVMQDAFLSAFRKLATYSEDVSFGAWLKKIVINRALDEIKKSRIIFEEINEQVTESIFDEKHDFDTTVVKANQVRDAIQKLPDKYRIVISLYLIEGYDHEEIGQIINMKSASVRSQYVRAKQKLQKLIEADW